MPGMPSQSIKPGAQAVCRSSAEAIAGLLERSFGPATAGIVAALRAPAPSARAAELDAHSRALRRALLAVSNAAAALNSPDERAALETLEAPLLTTGPDARGDALASALLAALPRARALPLALSLARLIEDWPRLASRRTLPLGSGFEELFARRLRARFALLPAGLDAFNHLELRLQDLLEEPACAPEILAELRSRCESADPAWLELERRVSLLRFVRRDKTDGAGHIRFYIAPDPIHDVRLARLGARGHWITDGSPEQIDAPRRRERLGHAPAEAWSALASAPASPPTGPERDAEDRSYRVEESGRRLRVIRVDGEGAVELASAEPAADPEGALRLVELLAALSSAALSFPQRPSPEAAPLLSAAASLVRAARRDRRFRVALVYVPSELPHQLGGVPEVGAAFLVDRLEREGLRAESFKIMARDFERRLDELLGADAVGVGVYIHNREEVAELLRRLRQAGYRGRIVLGGPEARSIDELMASMAGWDAIIRGEAEDALPATLRALRRDSDGDGKGALEAASALRGVALRLGERTLICDTAHRNRAAAIRCPLPFQWRRGGRRRLKMNFTRGCPYLCTFCPNHQGRAFRAGEGDELWRFAVYAAADALALSPQARGSIAEALNRAQGSRGLDLEPALALWAAAPRPREAALALAAELAPWLGEEPEAGLAELGLEPGPWPGLDGEGGAVSPRALRRMWLRFKAALLARRRADPQSAALGPADEPFIIETSEDNTLVNRRAILDFLERRRRHGLCGDFIFNPGQNTVRDLLDSKGEPDRAFIAALLRENPFELAFGADGTSNAILRQNRKPRYGVAALAGVNKALGELGCVAANNYILLTPETDLLEAVESFALFLLLPIPWRDYGAAINLRVIKEVTTLATDEGLIFAPQDQGWDVPLRCPELRALLERWQLSSMLPTRELRPRLWEILEKDEAARALLPDLVERWELDLDDDPELRALAAQVRSQGGDVFRALKAAEARIHAACLRDGKTIACIRDLDPAGSV